MKGGIIYKGKGHKTSDQCFTPEHLLTFAAEALGGPIETDPCWHPQSLSRPTKLAICHPVHQRLATQLWAVNAGPPIAFGDGLVLRWKGRTFVNWPYSNPGPWAQRFADHDAPAVALMRGDTGTRWFDAVEKAADWIGTVKGRVRFDGPGTTGTVGFYASIFAGVNCPPPVSTHLVTVWQRAKDTSAANGGSKRRILKPKGGLSGR